MSKLYETDFYAWTQQQSELLKKQAWEHVDIANLIEEIESLWRQERRELRNRLEVLLAHLLKWQYQPDRRGKSWFSTIREQRRKVNKVLQENPSLKPYFSEGIAEAYESAKDLAVRETNLDYENFPETCLYTTEQILAEYFPNDQQQ